MDAWLTARAADLGREIESGKIDPVDLTDAYISAIAGHRFSDRIYARTTFDRARAEAKAASDRAKSGLRRSMLDGVPISWKDLYDTAGVATESGSAFLKGRVPERDALVLRRATASGMVCLGKTHQTELAFSGLGLNPVTASPPCVNDVEAVSGGSSSGAAASVAFGLAVAGIGSDTGGSVRIPSVWNDLVGLKTVSGRLPLEGVVPLCPKFDTVGPLCRSVEDAALLLAAMDTTKPADLNGASLDGARLCVLKTSAFENIENAPARAFDDALAKLQAHGAVISETEIPEVAEAMSLAPVLFPAEAYGTWKEQIEAKGDLMYPPVRDRFLQGREIGAGEYVAGWQRLLKLRAVYVDRVSGFDAVILPSCPILPPKAADVEADAAYFTARNLLALQNTRIANVMGLAALTLPTGVASCGISFQGNSEERLLRLGAAAERALA